MVVAGVAMIAAFLAWFLFKGHDPLRQWVAENQLLAFGAWGLGWLCALGGAALLAGAAFRPGRSAEEEH